MPTIKKQGSVYQLPYENKGTNITEIPKNPAQLECEAKGGKWDSVNLKCILPGQPEIGKVNIVGEKTKEEKPKAAPTPEVFVDSRTGRPSGVTLPDGRTFLGASPNEVNRILERETQRGQLPQGTQIVGTAAQQQRREQELARMVQEGVLTPQEIEQLGVGNLGANNAFENVGTGGAALAGAIGGAKFGAAAGTAIAPGLGTAVGGIIGGVGGAIGGAYVKLGYQKKQDIKEANKLFTTAKTNKQEILNMVNAGMLSEGQARALWSEEKENIYISRNYLKKQTSSDLANFLGNPGDDLIAVESYLALDPFYDLEFEKALQAPNPALIRTIPLNNGEPLE